MARFRPSGDRLHYTTDRLWRIGVFAGLHIETERLAGITCHRDVEHLGKRTRVQMPQRLRRQVIPADVPFRCANRQTLRSATNRSVV